MVEIIPANNHIDEFLCLVKEYTDTILAEGEEVARTLAVQHLDDELGHVAAKYGQPGECMYIARVDGVPAGCGALTRHDADYCELKRLYVRPPFRAQKLGRQLLERIIGDARQLGYRYMRLDTFPFMETAIRLYETYGFRRIGKYNDNPAPSALFMELTLFRP